MNDELFKAIEKRFAQLQTTNFARIDSSAYPDAADVAAEYGAVADHLEPFVDGVRQLVSRFESSADPRIAELAAKYQPVVKLLSNIHLAFALDGETGIETHKEHRKQDDDVLGRFLDYGQ